MQFTNEILSEGAWRLRGLLPKARARVASLEEEGVVFSGLAESMRPYLYESNFVALVVFAGEKGGWLVDLLLRDSPPGTPNVVGTPVAEPWETKIEAIESGIDLLARALAMYREDAPSQPVFVLHDTEIALFPDMLRPIEELAKEMFPHGATPAVLAGRKKFLQSTLERCGLHEAFSAETFEKLSRDELTQFLASIHACAVIGVMAYPFREAAAPGKTE